MRAVAAGPGRVVLVDDDEASRYAVARVLRAEGLEVHEVASGREALAAAATGADLVLLDVRLPDLNGFDVCRAMRQHDATRRIPIVHLSACYTGDPDKLRGLDSGADAYLVHPVHPTVLVATVNGFVRARRAEAALRDSEARFTAVFDRERAAREEAETANRSKDLFLAVLSHELRTPLNVIVGWAQVLKTVCSDDPHVRQAIAAIERNADVQNQLIGDLLDVSRITSGKLTLDRQAFAPASAVDAALASLDAMARDRGVTIVRHDGSELGLVSWDRGRLTQVVWNLVGNAIKFSDPGGTVRVTLSRGADGVVVLEVADQGRGIAPDFMPVVFTRFAQQQSESGPQQGLGLGLAVVKHLVDAHGDRVEAESGGDGQGATFRVSFTSSSRH